MIKVYLTNLSQYTKGNLKGKWLTLPMDDQQLQKEIKNVLGNDEEYFITDHECPFEIGEYINITELNETMQEIKELNLDHNEFYALCKSSTISNYKELLQKIIDQDYTILEVTSENLIDGSDIAFELYENELISFLGKIPDDLIDYIDWDQVWRECEISYNWCEIFMQENGKQFAVNI